MTFAVPAPELQIDFAARLTAFRPLYLQDALAAAVRALNVPTIDRELATMVPPASLALLASHGLRGELVFPVPSVLRAQPRLLGYYRLLFGYSQKEFYTSATGIGRFSAMETDGRLSPGCDADLNALCAALCDSGATLLAGIGDMPMSAKLLDDLSLLTLGPQFRGGANVRRGIAGIRIVFNVIEGIVRNAVTASTNTSLELRNAAGRRVRIAFAPDPDIVITEEMSGGTERKLIAVEVKAGSDFSNIHNRIGEAEKSHQKARATGFTECWTVVNVDRIDIEMARRESPSTNRFYRISDLIGRSGRDYDDFRARVVALTGLSEPPPGST